MKNVCKLSLLIGICFMAFQNLKAQFEDSREGYEFIQASTQDRNKLFNAYMTPAYEGFAFALNSGWYNSAEAYNPLKFDIRFVAVGLSVPKDKQTYNVNELELENTYLDEGNPSSLPSVVSQLSFSKRNEQYFSPYNPVNMLVIEDGQVVRSFLVPQGGHWGWGRYMTIPMIPQITLGLWKETEVMIRFIPKMQVNIQVEPNIQVNQELIKSGTFQAFGIGFKHNIRQWIPKLKFIPFDLSIAVANFEGRSNLPMAILPENYPSLNDKPLPNFENQLRESKFNAFQIALLASKRFGKFSVWGGLRYENTRIKEAFTGDYPITTIQNGRNFVDFVNNPISVENQYKRIVFEGGFKQQFWIFSWFTNVTYHQYLIATTGLSFGSKNTRTRR